jgi:omega-hydroxy-beta-dihydromenaquinone-9 sulfotransferase
MAWRERLLLWTGPGFFAGITIGDWLALLRENRFAVDPPYWWRAAVISLGSLGNSLARYSEEAAFGRLVAGTEVEPPVFVLGIWRSGTTHLQNLLAVDDRLATPNWYQVSYPHTFLSTEAVASRLGGFFVPERRLQDDMRHGFGLPAEEEMALCVTTPLSPWLSWVFPRRADYYDRYLTLRGIPDAEVAEWKAALLAFVRKLAWKHRKPLVLKSPPHTARIRLLLDVFPEARFIHIHRNPYAVFQSSRHTTKKLVEYVALQRPALDVEGRTIRNYREIYDAFFEEMGLIRRDRFHEVRFEDLERDPIGQMRGIYEALRLPDFGELEPALGRYVGTLSGYRKNTYPEIPPSTRERIAQEWRRCFEAWGYPS